MVKRRSVKKAAIVGIIVILAIAIFFVVGFKSKKDLSQSSYTNSSIKIKTYKVENGWGYDVYINGKMLIHQPNIPAVSGNKGFAKESSARKVAEIVAEKIKKNIMPPGVTVDEIKEIVGLDGLR